jgi:hypothetical protein
MSQHAIGAIVILLVGLVLGVVAVVRIHSGVSYFSNPPSRFTREEDPFSFWLSVGPLVLFAIALVGAPLIWLIGQLIN